MSFYDHSFMSDCWAVLRQEPKLNRARAIANDLIGTDADESRALKAHGFEPRFPEDWWLLNRYAVRCPECGNHTDPHSLTEGQMCPACDEALR